jgi:hypothetical protein
VLNTKALHLPAFQKIGFRFDGGAKEPLGHRERLFQQPSRSNLANKVFPDELVS